MDNYIDIDTLNDLFYGSTIVETKYIINKYNPNDYKPKKISFEMTPMSKMIYDSVSTCKKDSILRDMMIDDNYIDDINELDPDYLEKLENNELGFYMEDFVCHNMRCPICNKKSLRKYSVKNMPVVDVICINSDKHDREIKLFQIKTTLDNGYFDRKKCTLLTGSKKYGYMCHEISGKDNAERKNLLVGYICINMTEVADNKYRISKTKSFVLVPNIRDENNQKYFSYTGKKAHFNNEILIWNPDMSNVYNINKFIDNMDVDATIIYNISDIVLNPYDRVAQKLIF